MSSISSASSYKLAIFVFTEWGEILLLKNPISDSPESGRWSVLEKIVSGNQSIREAAIEELSERLKLRTDASYLTELLSLDRVIEKKGDSAQVEDSGMISVFYAYILSWQQYQAVQHMRTRLVETVSNNEFLPEIDISTSLIQFVGTKDLFADAEAHPAWFSMSLLRVIQQTDIEEAIMSYWSKLVGKAREKVVDMVSKVTNQKDTNQDDDSLVMDAVLPSVENPAPEFEVRRIFAQGKQTCPGAYRIGEMMSVAGHLSTWNNKLSDPYHRYVEEELELLRRGIEASQHKKELDSINTEDACRFVRQVLHFPLEDGSLLRTGLGNLQEIAAGRRALRLYLLSKTKLPKKLIENPIKRFSQACNRIVRDVWNSKGWDLSHNDEEAVLNLLRLNVLLNSLDFKSRDFLDVWSDLDQFRAVVEEQFNAAFTTQFVPELGGDTFVREFLDQWVSQSRSQPTSLVYLTDNNGQLAVTLKCVEAFLRRCPNLTVILVPKNGQFGNDTSWVDVEQLLKEDEKSSDPIFTGLRKLRKQKRWILCRNGPSSEGLDPGNLSREFCFHLNQVDVVLAEGRAYAQIRGWHKPTYLIFPVKGRVAEALHGVPGGSNAPVFVRVGLGIAHFSHLRQLPKRVILPIHGSGKPFHAWGQTTADYTRAIISENYLILRDRLFGSREDTLLERLQEESLHTKRTLAQIVLGTTTPPGHDRVRRCRTKIPVDVFAIGGGGGFNQVTLKALKYLHVRVVAGVPSTDDGGSTGKLQKMIANTYGYIFGMGDAAAILEQQTDAEFKKRLLSYRSSKDADSLSDVIIEVVREMTTYTTNGASAMTDCPDFLSFVCEQLNLARTIDKNFLRENSVQGFRIGGASIRNLNILAAFHKCGALKSQTGNMSTTCEQYEENAETAWLLLEEALYSRDRSVSNVRVVPVTYKQAMLWAKYDKPIPTSEIERLEIPLSVLSHNNTKVYGQQYIDQIVPEGKIVDFGLAHSVENPNGPLPMPSDTYLKALSSARLIIVGAGSLFSSQLAQLAMPGVMDILIQRKNIRRILVVNHVCMNETSSYSLTDHIRAIERLANSVTSEDLRNGKKGRIQIGDIFSDIVVPRTVAREIDYAIARYNQDSSPYPDSRNVYPNWRDLHTPKFVTPDGKISDVTRGILRNRYVGYILDHPEFRQHEQITDWELRVLGFMEQPPVLYHKRSEAGRYRGAVYATEEDIKYLVRNGIPRRHIYEVESIAMNKKYLKASGTLEVEEFPGLIPESLIGIFRILLEKGQHTVI